MYKIYIGTEPRMWLGLAVLEYSIKKHTSKPVEVIHMNYADGGMWANWDMGRPPGIPATRTKNPKTGGDVWFTDFSSFRNFIPEANNFVGRAIYMDFDEIVLGDIVELFEMDMQNKPILSLTSFETSVMLMDCTKFKNLDWWKYGDEMKQSGWNPPLYNELLRNHDFFGILPSKWNCLNGDGYVEGYTKLVHYTAMNSQIHRPYPDRLKYIRHWIPRMEKIWMDVFYEMLDNNVVDMDKLQYEKAFLDFEIQYAKENGRMPIT